jgi:hypothetical protein
MKVTKCSIRFLGAVVYFYFAFNYTGVTQASTSSEFILIVLSFDVKMFCYHFSHYLILLKTWHTHNYSMPETILTESNKILNFFKNSQKFSFY